MRKDHGTCGFNHTFDYSLEGASIRITTAIPIEQPTGWIRFHPPKQTTSTNEYSRVIEVARRLKILLHNRRGKVSVLRLLHDGPLGSELRRIN